MKFYTPDEKDNVITYNGMRQYLQEDLSLLMDYNSTIARYYVVVRVTEDEALRKHISKLEKRLSELRAVFLKKWWKSTCAYGNPHCHFDGRHMGSCSD